MLSPQSQLMERNLALFEEGNWLIINPADAYFADQIDHRPVTFLHQYFDIFSESVRVIPCCEFDSRDVSHSEAGFCIEQKTGAHRHLFAPFIPAETCFSDILIYMPKSKAHMQMLLAMAVSALQEGGRIHIVGENKGGIKSIGKLIEKTGPSQKVDSARHCSLVTVMPEKAGTAFKPGDWIDESEYEVQGIQWEVVSMPGVFSHSELDDGTRMLLDKGSDRLRGKVLDFACGAGVIGAHLLRRFPHLDMTLLDVSALAIYCSARTLAANQQSATLVASDGLHGVNKSFSHIVTNPPFHTGVKTDYTVTRRFIEDSRRCLNSKGTLQMVANRFLPYPGLLGDIFPQTHTVAQDSRFSLYLSICGQADFELCGNVYHHITGVDLTVQKTKQRHCFEVVGSLVVNIVFAISEVEDLVKTGGLADVGKALPLALLDAGEQISIIMPYYKAIADEYKLADACAQQTLFAEGKVYHYNIKQLSWQGLNIYFIDYPEYFARDGLYSSTYEAYQDNAERFSFFCGAALNALQALSIQPDIIHCHDWHTAMLPFLLRFDQSGYFNQTKTVFTIHNAAFQGVHKLDDIPYLRHHPAILSQIHGGYINMLQSGIEFATKVTTVSPNYAKELLTDLGSHGLHDRLVMRQQDLSGILNGCDYGQWNPQDDAYLPQNYSVDTLHDKKTCKLALQELSHLPQNPDVPLLGMVCRLTEQKGFGYLVPILQDLMHHNVQMVIVGTGDPTVCMDLDEFAQNHPQQFAFINGFSTHHAHLVEAGADFFLMPSQFEPCGLNQMYSLAYGTLPIVRSVGGLKDTVIDQCQDKEHATGFVFDAPTPEALLACIRRALLFYYEHPVQFREMQIRGMQTRFTWEASAESYLALYRTMI